MSGHVNQNSTRSLGACHTSCIKSYGILDICSKRLGDLTRVFMRKRIVATGWQVNRWYSQSLGYGRRIIEGKKAHISTHPFCGCHGLVTVKLWTTSTHEVESPWPLHFKHSRWWKRRGWSKLANSSPILTGAGYQRMIPTSNGHFLECFSQWEPLVETNVGTHRSLVACTSKYGWAIIRTTLERPTEDANVRWM